MRARLILVRGIVMLAVNGEDGGHGTR